MMSFSFNRDPKSCVKCGTKFKPNCPVQKYCERCKALMIIERSTINNLKARKKAKARAV
jgi:hypothetical protein